MKKTHQSTTHTPFLNYLPQQLPPFPYWKHFFRERKRKRNSQWAENNIIIIVDGTTTQQSTVLTLHLLVPQAFFGTDTLARLSLSSGERIRHICLSVVVGLDRFFSHCRQWRQNQFKNVKKWKNEKVKHHKNTHTPQKRAQILAPFFLRLCVFFRAG